MFKITANKREEIKIFTGLKFYVEGPINITFIVGEITDEGKNCSLINDRGHIVAPYYLISILRDKIKDGTFKLKFDV